MQQADDQLASACEKYGFPRCTVFRELMQEAAHQFCALLLGNTHRLIIMHCSLAHIDVP